MPTSHALNFADREPYARRSLAIALFVAALVTGCVTATPLIRQAAALNSRGAAQLAAGDLEGAEASFQLALEYNGRYAEPHNNLGLVALGRGRFREARTHFRDAIARNRDFAEAWSNLGIALSRSEGPEDREALPERAANAFREALAVNPGLVEARLNLVRTLLAMGRGDEALTQARRLAQMFGNTAIAHALRAEAALTVGSMIEAATEAAMARQLSPGDPDVRLVSARVDMMLGARGAARSALRSLLNVPSMTLTAHALLAAIALADGDLEGARQELNEAGPGIERIPAARVVIAQLAERR